MGERAPLRVAIAGLGFGLKVILPALRACPGAIPLVLWHRNSSRAAEAAAAEGLVGEHDFDALLRRDDLDAVIVATPPGPRYGLGRAVLEAGKHLLLEKPVSLRAEEAFSLQRLALERGLIGAVDFEYRAVPLFMQLAELLERGYVGEPWLVKLDWLMGSRADPTRPWNWYCQRSAGGGVLGALGTHAFDSLAWMFGPITDVQARLGTVIRQRPDPSRNNQLSACDSDDVAALTLRFDSGLVGQVNLSSVTRNGRGKWLEVHGSEGHLVLGSANQKDYVHGFSLSGAKAGASPAPIGEDSRLAFPHTWPDGRIAPVARLLGWWADAIAENRPMIPGLAEGAASQAVMDAALAAADSGMVVQPIQH